ncbi:hypothetical protein LK994_07455 [Ferruginibacter lapsinanis]|uniref:hypothetical protein n=1 Tax=Ferruginibacter lapsinanis TaxID=563172 RepID=UPI001E574EDC|nr:hypothetical protein [Ferruginibacter lapsinanis]UEG51305.1 hypothetical protein LK994_07455 [Ferruginibacter lapsinanis]
MNRNTIIQILVTGILSIAFVGCTSSEIGESKDVAQDKIYQQYSVSYNQGEQSVGVFSQFRFAGEKGTTLVLTTPSKVELDGTPIQVDSSDYSGAFYRTDEPVNRFYGKHHFIFTDINNKKFENEFSFDQFKLVNVPVTAEKKQPLIIQYETPPLSGEDYIKLASANTDSSFSITHSAVDAPGTITIPVLQLLRQKGKTLSISATLYRRRQLQQNTTEGGKLTISYALNPVTITLK